MTDELFDYVTETLGPARASALRRFRADRLPLGPTPAPLHGWGVAIGPAGDLLYLKLELALPAFQHVEEEAAAYGRLHDLARRCGLEPLPHVASLAVHGPGSRLTVYTRFQEATPLDPRSMTERVASAPARVAHTVTPHTSSGRSNAV